MNRTCNKKLKDIIKQVEEKLPFRNYMRYRKGYLNIAKAVLKFMPEHGKILDFGAGAAEKTAILSLLGYECIACDDLADEWHKKNNNKNKILQFADKFSIKYVVLENKNYSFKKHEFDMIMIHDVLEHLHSSPRALLNTLLEFLRPNGYVFITVPNAVNIKKRIKVLLGQTNLPDFECYYWYPGKWRGHIREYVKKDLILLGKYLDLDILDLYTCNNRIEVLPMLLRNVFNAISKFFPGWKDSLFFVATKKPYWKKNEALPIEKINQILKKSSTYEYDKD